MFLLAWSHGIPAEVAFVAGVGSVLEAVVGISLTKATSREVDMNRLHGILRLVLFGVLIGPVFSASFGTFAFHFFMEPAVDPLVTWLFWWMGNSIAVLMLGTSILAFVACKENGRRDASKKIVDSMLNMILLLIVAVCIFLNALWPYDHISLITLLYFALPAAALLGLREGVVGAAFANMLALFLFLIAGWAFSKEHFSVSAIDSLYSHVAFLGLIGFTSLVLASSGREIREKDELDFKSSHDDLTQLGNRSFFKNELQKAVQSAAKFDARHAVIFIDLDGFKKVNDQEGHAAGDVMLKQIANAIALQVRDRDCVARWGGDEFTVLLWHCPLAHAQQIGKSILSAVAAQQLNISEREYQVTASIGLLPLDAFIETDSEAMQVADEACYEAKHNGGNQVVIASK